MKQNVEIPRILRCLLSKDADTGRWLGHCLDFDIVSSGKDEDKAWHNLMGVVRLHVEHCFSHWQDGLRFKASEDQIAIFDALKGNGEFRSEKITFNLIPPKKQQFELSPLWIQGIELTEGVGNVGTQAAHVQ